MKLIDLLSSGVRGAEDGSVGIFVRGTSTRAQIYHDFEGTDSETPSDDLTLDENGRPEEPIYVNQLVNVIVRDSSGVVVTEVVAGENASSVEVLSQSFTGIDYETAASAAGNPVPLSTVLDRWLTSAGRVDWNVLIGSTTYTIKGALAAFAGVFFNVKDPTFGAAGDGATDDSTAIAAANTAAQAAGGGIVYFPAGTYLTTVELVPGSKVSFMGAGSGASIITIDDPHANIFTFSSATGKDPQFIRGLQLKASQSNDGLAVSVTAAVSLNIDDCYLGNSSYTDSVVAINNASAIVNITNCTAEIGTNPGGAHLACLAGRMCLTRCKVVFPSTYNSIAVEFSAATGGNVTDCFFANSTVSSGTFYDIGITPAGVSVEGCTFPNAGGGTANAIFYGANVTTVEANNFYGTTVTRVAPAITAAATTHDGVMANSRDRYRYYVASDGAALTIDPNLYAELEVRRTNNGAQTLTLSTPVASNMYCCVVYNNDHAAGGGTITWAGNVQPSAATFSVNANKVTHHFFRSIQTKSLNYYWIQLGTLANQSP